LFSLDVITRRSIPLYFAPIIAFAIIAWIVLCMFAPPAGQASQSELVGLLAFASVAVCPYTAGRLYPRRETPDLRIPFFLNAAGLAVLVGWFALSLFSGLWQALMHRAA
jgi:hypothetical protein